MTTDNSNLEKLLSLFDEYVYTSEIEFKVYSTSPYATGAEVSAICEKISGMKLRLRQIADLAAEHGLLNKEEC